jgi:hypothetical protein
MNLYIEFARSFGKTLDRMNIGDREEGSNGRRRQKTLHSFRRFVKTTISDLGYSDLSEYVIIMVQHIGAKRNLRRLIY